MSEKLCHSNPSLTDFKDKTQHNKAESWSALIFTFFLFVTLYTLRNKSTSTWQDSTHQAVWQGKSLFWVSVVRNVQCLAQFALLCHPGCAVKVLGKAAGLSDRVERENSVRCGSYLYRHPQRRKENKAQLMVVSERLKCQRTLQCREIVEKKNITQICFQFSYMFWMQPSHIDLGASWIY